MKLLFLGASNTDCGHCFSEDNLGYGYVKMVHDLLQEAQPVVINGGTDGFTFPRICRKWEQNWEGTAFNAVFVLGGINEVGALMDSGMDESSHRTLLQRSADALSALLAGLSAFGCPQIFVLEPFLFDTPQYLKNWMGTLEEVREMIRQTVLTCGGEIRSAASLSSNSEFAVHFEHSNCIHLFPTQLLLDDAVQRLGISEITKDGIHLAQQGHRILAEMIVSLIDAIN